MGFEVDKICSVTKETQFGNHKQSMRLTEYSGTVCVHTLLRPLHGSGVNPLFSSEDRVICRAKGSLFFLWASPESPAQASP